MQPTVQRLTGRILVTLVVAIALVYVGDYAAWRVRLSHGSGTGSLAVDQYLATPLKGNKAEYDFLGTVQQPCARAIFPHGGNNACWWVARHTSQWE
jgi:hypothetical protein